MAWLKLDDTMPQHDKITDITVEARWLYIAGLCWSSSLLTDGKIARNKLRRIEPDVDSETALLELVRVGLWELDDAGDIHIVNYLRHQRSAEDVKRQREYARTRAARSREVRAHVRANNGPGARETESRTEQRRAHPELSTGIVRCIHCRGVMTDHGCIECGNTTNESDTAS